MDKGRHHSLTFFGRKASFCQNAVGAKPSEGESWGVTSIGGEKKAGRGTACPSQGFSELVSMCTDTLRSGRSPRAVLWTAYSA